MATTKRFDEFTPVFQGLSGETDIKLKDVIPVQHIHVASAEGEQSINGTRRLSVADTMCKPYIVASAIDGNGVFTASCRNFSDFSTTLTDSEGNSHSLLGLTVKIRFDVACNYGDGSSTYPKININSLGAVPITCQGKLAASGFCGAGQQFEATLSLVNINGTETLTWDIDTNVKGYANGIIDNADGTQVYNKSQSDSVLNSALAPFKYEGDIYQIEATSNDQSFQNANLAFFINKYRFLLCTVTYGYQTISSKLIPTCWLKQYSRYPMKFDMKIEYNHTYNHGVTNVVLDNTSVSGTLNYENDVFRIYCFN